MLIFDIFEPLLLYYTLPFLCCNIYDIIDLESLILVINFKDCLTL